MQQIDQKLHGIADTYLLHALKAIQVIQLQLSLLVDQKYSS